MFRVGIIGAESTGKTTLARYLAKRYNGIYVPEYARTYVERKGSTEVSYDELCEIARYQINELKNLSEKRSGNETVYQAKPIFFDTELIITKVWFEYAFGIVPSWLNEAIQNYPMDVYLLTYPDIPWIPDPARSNGSNAIRHELTARYEQEIQSTDKPYYIIRHS